MSCVKKQLIKASSDLDKPHLNQCHFPHLFSSPLPSCLHLKLANCTWGVVIICLNLLSPKSRTEGNKCEPESVTKCWKPEKSLETGAQETRNQSFAWHKFYSAWNIILQFKFPLLNPNVQCRIWPLLIKNYVKFVLEDPVFYLAWTDGVGAEFKQREKWEK